MKTKITITILFVLLFANTFSQNTTKKTAFVTKLETLVQLTDSQKVILNNAYKKMSDERKKINSQSNKNDKVKQKQIIGQNFQATVDSILTKEHKDTIMSKTYSNK
jgi:hypothetical protein